MKTFDWDPEKNAWLIQERGLSFEEVVFHIMSGDVLKVYEHPNQEKYPNQRIYALLIEDYVYLVPFVESGDQIFLKTIIPSRKATKQQKAKRDE